MKDYAVLGGGRFGATIAIKLTELGQNVLLVDNNEALVDKLSTKVSHAVFGDITKEGVLESLELKRFDVVIIAISSNFESSIIATVMAKEMGVPTVICKAKDQRRAEILKKLGADKVLIPEMDVANRMAVSLVSNGVLDFIDLSDGLTIAEVKVPDDWVGKSLLMMDIRQRYGISVIAIKVNHKLMMNPDPSYLFHNGEHLIVVGDNTQISEIFEYAGA